MWNLKYNKNRNRFPDIDNKVVVCCLQDLLELTPNKDVLFITGD